MIVIISFYLLWTGLFGMGTQQSVEEYLGDIAEDKGIPGYGSYDSTRLQCTDEDFLDGMHMRREDIYKAWNIVN